MIITATHHRLDLEHAALAATILAGQIDPAVTHLTRQRDYHDGMTTSTPGAATSGGRTVTIRDDNGQPIDQIAVTTVEAAVIHRQTVDDQLGDITAHIAGIVTMLRELSRLIQRALATTATRPVPRCSASGRDGSVEWGDANCGDMPARGPLCARCYMRERRWRQGHGLPTREDSVA